MVPIIQVVCFYHCLDGTLFHACSAKCDYHHSKHPDIRFLILLNDPFQLIRLPGNKLFSRYTESHLRCLPRFHPDYAILRHFINYQRSMISGYAFRPSCGTSLLTHICKIGKPIGLSGVISTICLYPAIDDFIRDCTNRVPNTAFVTSNGRSYPPFDQVLKLFQERRSCERSISLHRLFRQFESVLPTSSVWRRSLIRC